MTPGAGLAQQPAPRPPLEVPYLNYPGSSVPGMPGGAAGSANPTDATKQPASLELLKEHEQELAAIRAEQRRALDTEARLKREIDSIGDDRHKLNTQLLEAAAGVRDVEDKIAQSEARLAPLDERERSLRKSLDARRGAMAEILAAMQRIGRHPPPAIFVRAEDALQSVRSAMVLGAVLPEMRHDAERLLADLAELVRLRQETAEEQVRLAGSRSAYGEASLRLTLLIEQRQAQQVETEKTLAAERQRTAQLGRQAASLQDLIARLGQVTDEPGRAGRPGGSGNDEKNALTNRPDLAALEDPGRLSPAVAFASAKGLLPLPVNGPRIKEFGAADGLGGTEKGVTIAARPGAQITSPCDGWVVYAGPYRNYGQLLILNAGGGYHVLVAGMERVSVDLGQFVVTGEPVAVMGGKVQSASALTGGAGQPVLYVEFRKDGTPVDPSPWWAASESKKVRG